MTILVTYNRRLIPLSQIAYDITRFHLIDGTSIVVRGFPAVDKYQEYS
jgi:hypothetical protein